MRHDHDLDDRCGLCNTWPAFWLDLAIRITELKEIAMTEAFDQQHLDADVQAENDALTTIEAEIAALKAQPAAASLDFTALDAAVSRVQADAPAAPAPAPVVPVTPADAAGGIVAPAAPSA